MIRHTARRMPAHAGRPVQRRCRSGAALPLVAILLLPTPPAAADAPDVARYRHAGLGYSVAWQEGQWWRVPLPEGGLPVQVKLVRVDQPDTTCTVGAGPLEQLNGLTAREAAAQVNAGHIRQALNAVFPNAELVGHKAITLGGEPAVMARFRYHADLVAFQVPFEGLGVAMARGGNVYVAECNGLAARFAEVDKPVKAVLGSLRLDPAPATKATR
ncbi:MAG: hypothetical protein HZA24_08655 [Nitrospirae bacterium]|nr:hypothetical protein [Nitrospirota bacterium]